MKKVINLILLVFWIVIIFLFSNQNGTSSTNSSNIIVKFLYDLTKINEDILIVIIRKCAHIFEYFILYLLTYNCFKEYKTNKYMMISFCILCGIIDEIHQLFINGRSGNIIDIFVDSIGIIIGFILIEVTYGKKKVEKNSSS